MFEKYRDFYWKIFILVILIVDCKTSEANIRPKANFSGYWEINILKCDFGNLDRNSAAASTIFLEQTNDNIILQRFFNGIEKIVDTLNLRGKVHTTQFKKEGYSKSSSLNINFGKDKAEFMVISDYKDDSGNKTKNYQRSEIYSLSADNKELTLLRTFNLPEGIVTIKVVYDNILSADDFLNAKIEKLIVNFSGKWRINMLSSNFGLMKSEWVAVTLAINQVENRIQIDKKYSDNSGNVELLHIDGITRSRLDLAKNIISDNINILKRGNVLGINSVPQLKNENINRIFYILSDNNRILTVHHLTIGLACNTMKTVYERIQ